MYQVDLLSVLRGISKSLAKAEKNAYVECAKDQLDEIIQGLTPKEIPYPEMFKEETPTDTDLDPEAELARKELLREE